MICYSCNSDKYMELKPYRYNCNTYTCYNCNSYYDINFTYSIIAFSYNNDNFECRIDFANDEVVIFQMSIDYLQVLTRIKTEYSPHNITADNFHQMMQRYIDLQVFA